LGTDCRGYISKIVRIRQLSHHISCMGVSHEGKYCTKFLNQNSFICSKFYKLYKYNINISHIIYPVW
jgi:hypothetical protein